MGSIPFTLCIQPVPTPNPYPKIALAPATQQEARKGRALVARPPGLLCETCLKRELTSRIEIDVERLGHEIHIFQLKLRDWLNVEGVETRPCLSRCPEVGVTIERRGKQMVLSREEIQVVNSQFDPTRQLSFFGPEEE
jgi:hypothetical protein